MGIARRLGTTRFRFVTAAVLGGTALPLGAAAAPAAPCAAITRTADGWQRIAVPAFDERPAELTAYAVLPQQPATLFATNGESVGKSTDGGCTWRRVFTADAEQTLGLPFAPTTARIADVVAGQRRVYLLVIDLSGPRVVVSADRGTTWEAVQLPVAEPGIGRTPTLVSDATGMYAYLLARPGETFGTGRDEVFFATTDGGTTWTPQAVDPAAVPPHLNVRDIAVDPLSGTDVYAATDAGLVVSRDAGQSWELVVRNARGDFDELAVTRRPGKAIQVLVASQYEPLVHLHTPAGGWTPINTPEVVTSFVGGRDVSQAAITTPTGTYELDFDALTWSRIHRGNPPLSRLSTDFTSAPLLYACDCGDAGALWTRPPRHPRASEEPPRGAENPEFPGFDGCAPPGRRPMEPASYAPSAVTAPTREVALEPGQTKQVTYTMRVQPRLLDVYYLVDSGQASYAFACAASQGGTWAAQRLARTRNVRVGLGQYRDYPRLGLPQIFGLTCVADAPEDYVYRRRLRVGPVDGAFRDTMRGLQWDGSCSGDYAGLAALYQSATGSGQDVFPTGSSPYDIKDGMDAGFAPDAYKVIVHVAGAAFDTPERNASYPGPRFDDVIDALRQRDVKQIGISVPPPKKKKDHSPNPEPVPDGASADDLRRIAAGTGTFAARPVSCGSQVKAHVAVGKPLVCTFVDDADGRPGRKAPTAPAMGRQIADLVSALTDVQPMRVTLLDGSDPVATLSSTARQYRDHLVRQTLRVTVTYKCRAADQGEVKQVQLGGEVGSTVVATTTTTVRCGAPPVPRKRQEFFPPLGLVVPVAAPAAPNLPPQNLAPNTAPQPNANPQNLPQGVGGAVPQTDEQPRLAYADAGERQQPFGQDELAMSARPRRSPYDMPAWVFLQVAGMLSGAGAYAVRRSRTANARVRTQRF